MGTLENRLKQLEAAKRGKTRRYFAIVDPDRIESEWERAHPSTLPGWPIFGTLETARASCPAHTTFIVVKRDRKPLEDSTNARY